MSTGLSAERIAAALTTRELGRTLRVFDSIGSTNDEALDLLSRGAPHGTLVVADRQWKGRGQRGRVWHSPPGVAVYASVVLRAAVAVAAPTGVVAAVGLGLAEGIETATGVRCDIKWPNDLWSGGCKVAGVLVESRGYRPDHPAMVAGFGINVNQRHADFPPEVRSSATSLAIAAGRRIDRETTLAAVLSSLEEWVEVALCGPIDRMESAYRERSCLRGREVRLLDGDTPLRGHVEDLSATEGLLLRQSDGTRVHVRAEHAREVRPVA